MAEPYYTLYFNWIEDTQELNDQEKGRLIDAIVLYDVVTIGKSGLRAMSGMCFRYIEISWIEREG